MLRIGMCDDCGAFLDETQYLISNYFANKESVVELHSYQTGEALLHDFGIGDFQLDLIFLDIDMPGINGMDLAGKIRSQDQKVLLVFLSGLEERVFETFKFSPFRFIRKKKVGEELKECLDKVIDYFNHNKEIFTFKSQEGLIRLPIEDILYFSYFKRRVEIYTFHKQYSTVSLIFKEIIEQFKDRGFIPIHRSSMVNVKYIKTVNKLYIVLDNNQRLSISRYKYNEVFEAFTNYAK